jgi:phospho-N-acetylmuramoyl-pentapeptide-transferase
VPAFYTAIIAFLVSLIICPLYIRFSPFGQQIRSDGPGRHSRKAGTPTMGGVVFLFSLLLVMLFFVPITPVLLTILMITLAGGVLGLVDDYQKVTRHRSLGLKARHKLGGQFIFSLLFYFVLIWFGHSTVVQVPFSGMQVDFGYFYPLLIFVMIMGTANGVNLTDGIDGLAGGTAILALLAFLILASQQGLGGLVYFCAILIGAVFGFLIFNLHPARVFMGDVGSLSLGTALAVVAILTKAELLLVIIGGVFRSGNPISNPAGHLIQAHGPAHFSHEPAAPPLRVERVVRMACGNGVLGAWLLFCPAGYSGIYRPLTGFTEHVY